jgi:hypothetical protein
MDLSNREVAWLVWLALGTTFLSWKTSFLPLLVALLKQTSKAHKLLLLLGVMIFYVLGCVFLLNKAGLWTIEQLKASLIWFITFAVVAIFDAVRIDEERHFFRKTLREAISASVVIQFMIETYVFSFPVELAIAPLVLVLVLVNTVSKGAKIETSTTVILAVIFVVMLLHSGYEIARDVNGLWTRNNIREFAAPIMLTLLLLPFLFYLNIYVAYEMVFHKLNWSVLDISVRRYAKIHALFSFGSDLKGVLRWTRLVARKGALSWSDVRDTIKRIRDAQHREADPKLIPPSLGWSPHIANTFLHHEGLVLRNYDDYGDSWRASSSYLNLGDSVLPNNISYGIEGDALVVDHLWLMLNVNEPDGAESSQQRFLAVACTLVREALAGVDDLEGLELSTNGQPVIIGQKHLTLRRTDWSGGVAGGYEIVLDIRHLTR